MKIVFVKLDSFNSASTPLIAKEISEFNAKEIRNESYLLVGPGRWGSTESLLGIPVDWNDISKVGAIVEVGLPSFFVEPSFGSHFFQNLSSLGVDYFFTSPKNYQKNINLAWWESRKPEKETPHLKVFRFQSSLTIQIDGKDGYGFILKSGLLEKYQQDE